MDESALREGGERVCGYPIYTDEQVLSMVKTALSDEVQLLAHCNGDAAAEQMITCYERALAEMPKVPSLRPVMIHAQLVRPDQLARMRHMGMMASFCRPHLLLGGCAPGELWPGARPGHQPGARGGGEPGALHLPSGHAGAPAGYA